MVSPTTEQIPCGSTLQLWVSSTNYPLATVNLRANYKQANRAAACQLAVNQKDPSQKNTSPTLTATNHCTAEPNWTEIPIVGTWQRTAVGRIIIFSSALLPRSMLVSPVLNLWAHGNVLALGYRSIRALLPHCLIVNKVWSYTFSTINSFWKKKA